MSASDPATNKAGTEDDSHEQRQLAAAKALLHLRRTEEASRLISQELQERPRQAVWLELSAYAAMQANKLIEAEKYWRILLEIDATNSIARNSLHYLLKSRGAEDELEGYLRHSAARLASMLENNEQRDKGAKQNQKLVQAKFETHLLYAQLLRERKSATVAQRVLQDALQIYPANPDANNLLGLLHYDAGRFAEAKQAYEKALQGNQNHSAAWCNLGLLAQTNENYVEAEEYYKKSLTIEPRSTTCLNSLALMQHSQNNLDEAEDSFKRALQISPNDLDTQSNYSLLLLHQGRYRQAWRYYEARLSPKRAVFKVRTPAFAFPRWQGQPLAGRSIVLWPEQGHGDNIQFARLIPLLKQRLAACHVSLRCYPALMRLFSTLEGVDEVLPHKKYNDPPAASVAGHDYWEFTMSLPHRLQITLANLPARTPYLLPTQRPDWLASWLAGLRPNRLRVGLVWRGRTVVRLSNHRRTIENLQVLLPLWSVQGVDFYSLQKGDGEDEALSVPLGQPLEHLGDRITDFADLATIMTNLHLIISIDTAAAHLANAINAPCWVLLPPVNDDWRWGKPNSPRSPWYPHARLFRHDNLAGDWPRLVENVRAALAEYVEEWRSQGMPDHST